MRVIEARNVQEALPIAVRLLQKEGVERETRNGPALVAPWPVTTVYRKPCERVLFWPQRDANPFFHLYESLWMLAGRDDVAPLLRYAKQMAAYSDDGETLDGAYGYRWRHHFLTSMIGITSEVDQLPIIAKALRENPEDRRQILQMWDVTYDLGRIGKDLPCNTIATFQRDANGKLDLTVFCRSNDIVWGCYGANAVHFSFLLEYMANWIGCPVGVYRQVSVNWHAYLKTLEPVSKLHEMRNPYQGVDIDVTTYGHAAKEYIEGTPDTRVIRLPIDIPYLDAQIQELFAHVESDFELPRLSNDDEPFIEVAYAVLRSHAVYKKSPAPERFKRALEVLSRADQGADWVQAAQQWIERREAVWIAFNR